MRLIDADELADRLTKMWAYAMQDNDPFGQGEMNALVGAIRAVNEAPTVNELGSVKEQPDVVQCKCKDCKFWFDPIGCKLYSEGIGTGGDWFCADGERQGG